KRVMSSFDLHQIVRELKTVLSKSRVAKIYNPNPTIILLRLHPENSLLLEAGRRVHLTNYCLNTPKTPSFFCSFLRRCLDNGRIDDIWVEGFERVLYISVNSRYERYRLVVEIFGSGNIILLDDESRILGALKYRRMKDREILRGRAYKPPPLRGTEPSKATIEDLKKFLPNCGNIAQAVSWAFNLGSPYVEEVLFRAGVEKNTFTSEIGELQLESILNALRNLLADLENPRPRIVVNKMGQWIDVLPLCLSIYQGYDSIEFESFNEAADTYFTKLSVQLMRDISRKKLESELGEQRRIVEQQFERLRELTWEEKECQRIGDILYSNVACIQGLLDDIGRIGLRQVKMLIEEKKDGLPSSFGMVRSIDKHSGMLKIELDGVEIVIDPRKSVYENAQEYYARAKKARQKSIGVLQAIDEAQSRLRRMEETQTQEGEDSPLRRRERPWYEKFRWGRTRNGLLIVAGRDASSNEVLVKRHMESNDLVFHAEIPGAPFTLLKTEGKKVSEEDLLDAALLASSYSSAWKSGLVSVDVFWVRPDQVSAKPPSGEYLTHGAFMVRGEKNYIRNVPLRLAIGLTLDGELRLTAGSASALDNLGYTYVEIMPGRESSASLAKAILKKLAVKNTRLRSNILKIPLEEVQRLIPSGGGEIVASKV
ncbi:MAG: ribosome rescue protein RqcH, partial [Candidatus Bathyarchaeia archaeon]